MSEMKYPVDPYSMELITSTGERLPMKRQSDGSWTVDGEALNRSPSPAVKELIDDIRIYLDCFGDLRGASKELHRVSKSFAAVEKELGL